MRDPVARAGARVAVPAKSEKQMRFMAAEYERAKEGKATRSGISAAKAHDFMEKPKGGYKKGKGK